MNKTLRHITGIVLVVLAAVSILLSLFFIVQVWRIKETATQGLISAFQLVDDTLIATSQGLEVAQSTMNSASSSALALQSALEGLTKTLDDSAPMIVTIEDLFSEDLPNTVRSTQESLASAQSSAEIIDNVLRYITAIPLISSRYEPETPLHVALGQISEDIDGLPDQFSELEQDLKKTRSNLIAVKADINQIASDIGIINQSLIEAQDVIRQYRTLIAEAQLGVINIISKIPGWMDILAWILTFVFLWLAITQFGLLLQGWEMVREE